MKKVAALLLCVCFLAAFAACGGETAEQEKSEESETVQNNQPEMNESGDDAKEESSAVFQPLEADVSEPAVPANSNAEDKELYNRFNKRFNIYCIVDIYDFFDYASAGEKAFINWMLDNPIDKCIDEYWQKAMTTGDMVSVATVELENWMREVDETLDELKSLLPEDLYTQLADITERRIKADTEAVDYSHMFRSWIWGWAGTMYGPISIEYKTYLVKSVCAELKIYEIRTYYCKRENHTVNGAELTYGMLDIPADISEFTEKYPITFENPLGDFLD